MKSLVVLDVNNTLVFNNEELNVPLLETLQASGVQDVILLTDINADEVVKALTNQSVNPYLSSAKLIKIMKETYGINVVDVIMPADFTLVNTEHSDPTKIHRMGAVYSEINDWLEGENRKIFDKLMYGRNTDEFFFTEIEESQGQLYILKDKFKEFRKRINAAGNKASIVAYALKNEKKLAEVEEDLGNNCLSFSELPNAKGQMLKAYVKQHPELDNVPITYFGESSECVNSMQSEFRESNAIQVSGKEIEQSAYESVLGVDDHVIPRGLKRGVIAFLEDLASFMLSYTAEIAIICVCLVAAVFAVVYLPLVLSLSLLGVGAFAVLTVYIAVSSIAKDSAEESQLVEPVIQPALESIFETVLESSFEPEKALELKPDEESLAKVGSSTPIVDTTHETRPRRRSMHDELKTQRPFGLVRRHSTGELNSFFPKAKVDDDITFEAPPVLVL